MADLIKVNTSRLKTDASDVQSHIRSITKDIEDLKAHSTALDGMWDGEASEAFKAAFATDIKNLETIVESLSSLNNYETNARQKYDECESKVGDLVDQIKTGGGYGR